MTDTFLCKSESIKRDSKVILTTVKSDNTTICNSTKYEPKIET